MGFERRDLDELDMAICDSLLLLESFDDEDFNRDERHGQHNKFILISFFFFLFGHIIRGIRGPFNFLLLTELMYGTLGCVNDYGECVVRTIILLILILYTIQYLHIYTHTHESV